MLAQAPHAVERFAPIAFLQDGSRWFSRGPSRTSDPIDYHLVTLDPDLGLEIAAAYMAAPRWEARALPAYRALRLQTLAQFAFLTSANGLRVTVEVVNGDPYEDAGSMAEDLARRRLKVYSSRACGNPHPFFTDSENDMFRAVHDAFGHAATGCGFDRDGEEAAWLKHCTMYSPLARQALSTETRGQSCAQQFHFEGKEFPEQKLILLPGHLRRSA